MPLDQSAHGQAVHSLGASSSSDQNSSARDREEVILEGFPLCTRFITKVHTNMDQNPLVLSCMNGLRSARTPRFALLVPR